MDKGLFIDYSIKVALGAFLTKDYPRKILEEKLSVNEKMIFFRNDHLDIKLSAVIKAYLNKGIKNNTVGAISPLQFGMSSNDEEATFDETLSVLLM